MCQSVLLAQECHHTDSRSLFVSSELFLSLGIKRPPKGRNKATRCVSWWLKFPNWTKSQIEIVFSFLWKKMRTLVWRTEREATVVPHRKQLLLELVTFSKSRLSLDLHSAGHLLSRECWLHLRMTEFFLLTGRSWRLV